MPTPTPTNAQSHSHISTHLQQKHLPISPTWLHHFISTQRPTTPLPALTRTCLFRLLASDFTTSLSTTTLSSLLPVDISDSHVKERMVMGVVPVQVLDIEDVGASRWSQVEGIERVERGEETKGREVIRTVTRDEDGSGPAPIPTPGSRSTGTDSLGPYRLLLQDARGTKATAFELEKIEGVAIEKMSIGAKLLLRNVSVARGMVLLEPRTVTVLGGMIEVLDKKWREGRKGSLIALLDGADGDVEMGDA